VLEIIEYYHETVHGLQALPRTAPNPYGGTLTPGTEAWQELLDSYTTSVTYFLATRDLSSIRTDLDAAVNTDLERQGYRPLEIQELTGGTSTDDVTRILDRLQMPAPRSSTHNAVLATNMISHGVDIDRLNLMIFYGMPRQNAEYIQSSSRVGRSHVGVIFNCLHPARERDQSHYSYFTKFHEYLGQMIEPVAINRWSKFSIQRTLPGLFMAVLLQLISNRAETENPNLYYMLSFVKQEISRGNIRGDDFIPLLREAYCVDAQQTAGAASFAAEINTLVRLFLDQIIAAGTQQTFVSDALIPRPMNSLREVDELLEIKLDDNGTQWSARTSKGS
jgi:hypothetical protein